MARIELHQVSKRYNKGSNLPFGGGRSGLPSKRAQAITGYELNITSEAEDLSARPDADLPYIAALDAVDLTIDDGEAVAIIGPSGCGKSTLLRVVAGLDFPDSGLVLYDGVDQGDIPPKDRGIGMVFQDYALYPHMDSRENMGFFFRIRQREQEIDERVRLTAEILGVDFRELLARKPKQLSGGQRQRVAIGRCIIRDPKLFLFDEPLSNLDAKLRTQTRLMIKRLLTRFKITAIYVTHDQIEAMALGDRIAVMQLGRVVQIGPYADLYDQPANDFVAGFLGLPPMNLFEGWLEGDQFTNREVALKLPARLLPALSAGQPLKLGLRPEHVGLAEHEDQADLMGLVEVVEPIPSERIQLVHLKTDLGPCIAKWPLTQRIYLDAHLPLSFPDHEIHLFDRAGGQRIAPV